MNEKQLEIMERASAVYMKFGVKSVTMDDLAREMGISKKTIYQYFTDKNHLVNSIIDMKLGMEQAICRNATHISKNAIEGFIEMSKLVVEHLKKINPVVFYDLKKYHPEAWNKMEEHQHIFVRSLIKQNVEQGIQEKLYRENLNPEIISRLYVHSTAIIINGTLFPWPEFKFQEVYAEMIEFQLHGLLNENGRNFLSSNPTIHA